MKGVCSGKVKAMMLLPCRDRLQTSSRQAKMIVQVLNHLYSHSCCVDEVAAEHVGADAVIHFGNTCLSPSQRLPVLYIPTRLQVDTAWVVEQLKAALQEEVNGDHPLIFLFDTRCQHAAGMPEVALPILQVMR